MHENWCQLVKYISPFFFLYKLMKCDPYLTSIHWADMFLIGFWSIVMLWSPFVLFYNVTISIGRLQKKIHTYTMDSFLEFWRGVLWTENPKVWGYLQLEFQGHGGFLERTDKNWRRRKARCKTSINQRFHNHLQKKTPKILSYLSFGECRPAMSVSYAPAIHIHKGTTVTVSDQVNTVCNIKGKLGRIYPPSYCN